MNKQTIYKMPGLYEKYSCESLLYTCTPKTLLHLWLVYTHTHIYIFYKYRVYGKKSPSTLLMTPFLWFKYALNMLELLYLHIVLVYDTGAIHELYDKLQDEFKPLLTQLCKSFNIRYIKSYTSCHLIKTFYSMSSEKVI